MTTISEDTLKNASVRVSAGMYAGPEQEIQLGSGFVVQAENAQWLITNSHVVEAVYPGKTGVVSALSSLRNKDETAHYYWAVQGDDVFLTKLVGTQGGQKRCESGLGNDVAYLRVLSKDEAKKVLDDYQKYDVVESSRIQYLLDRGHSIQDAQSLDVQDVTYTALQKTLNHSGVGDETFAGMLWNEKDDAIANIAMERYTNHVDSIPLESMSKTLPPVGANVVVSGFSADDDALAAAEGRRKTEPNLAPLLVTESNDINNIDYVAVDLLDESAMGKQASGALLSVIAAEGRYIPTGLHNSYITVNNIRKGEAIPLKKIVENLSAIDAAYDLAQNVDVIYAPEVEGERNCNAIVSAVTPTANANLAKQITSP